jgi:hypothetical protein
MWDSNLLRPKAMMELNQGSLGVHAPAGRARRGPRPMGPFRRARQKRAPGRAHPPLLQRGPTAPPPRPPSQNGARLDVCGVALQKGFVVPLGTLPGGSVGGGFFGGGRGRVCLSARCRGIQGHAFWTTQTPPPPSPQLPQTTTARRRQRQGPPTPPCQSPSSPDTNRRKTKPPKQRPLRPNPGRVLGRPARISPPHKPTGCRRSSPARAPARRTPRRPASRRAKRRGPRGAPICAPALAACGRVGGWRVVNGGGM